MSASEALSVLEPAATRVRDPVSGRSVWMANLIRDPALTGDTLSFVLALQPDHSKADAERIQEALLRNIAGVGFSGTVNCSLRTARQAPEPPKTAHQAPAPPKKDPVPGMSGGGMQPHGGPFVKESIPGVKHLIAVASGKGGVGKSTVSTNLAVALSRSGYSVGLMDADIYGPSLPTMMNVRGRPLAGADKRIIPLEAYGAKCMSMGFLVPEGEAIIWRGPMVMGAVRQFLHQVDWGELDVLIVDLPPGTGDAQLTMIQTVPISGAVIVTTPQQVAVIDAVRAIEMFRKLDVPVLGIIENMSWMELPNGARTQPFGEGGGLRTAEKFDVPLLAQVPFDARICAGGDAGVPVAYQDEGPGQAFRMVAKSIADALGLG
jgi:ATP-binding protein involved in chromosome partitioning